jgi:hypothetical protein
MHNISLFWEVVVQATRSHKCINSLLCTAISASALIVLLMNLQNKLKPIWELIFREMNAEVIYEVCHAVCASFLMKNIPK